MASYTSLRNKQAELIRKAIDGSVFIAPETATAITDLTTHTPGPPVVIDLTTLPTEYDDLGWLTEDGAQFSRDVNTSDVTSWGSVTPTRSDITSDTSTMAVTCQETKLLTIGIATGTATTGVTPDVDSGEVGIAKPLSPTSRYYRVLSLAVDQATDGDVFIGRFFPRAKVTEYSEQSFSGGDDPITWGITFTGYPDSTLGYSEKWLFGGPGWQGLLTAMGFS